MKQKKYNLSLSTLYEENDLREGFGRLRNKARYQDPAATACKIDMNQYDNIRQFIFNVGQYGSKNDHTKAMGVLANTFPAKILSSIEALNSFKIEIVFFFIFCKALINKFRYFVIFS